MKKGLKIFIKTTAVIIAVIILGFSAFYMYIYFDIKKSPEYAEKYEAQYEQSKDPVDLLNACYRYIVIGNNEKSAECAKNLIDLVTVDTMNDSELSTWFEESQYDDPRGYIISIYLMNLLECKEYDLFIQEHVKYYTEAYSNGQGNNVTYFTTVSLLPLLTDKDLLKVESEIKAYEQIIDSTDNDDLKKMCQMHIDILNDFIEDVKQTEAGLNSAS